MTLLETVITPDAHVQFTKDEIQFFINHWHFIPVEDIDLATRLLLTLKKYLNEGGKIILRYGEIEILFHIANEVTNRTANMAMDELHHKLEQVLDYLDQHAIITPYVAPKVARKTSRQSPAQKKVRTKGGPRSSRFARTSPSK